MLTLFAPNLILVITEEALMYDLRESLRLTRFAFSKN